jgi:hypothetical protein
MSLGCRAAQLRVDLGRQLGDVPSFQLRGYAACSHVIMRNPKFFVGYPIFGTMEPR